ncbi:hypothetical protein [Pseudomonas sp. UMAB-40]|uniref:hypothetical protein n=1 Tax=Pseudomonas sp. UMAB-40 TaxID=1365407 RepID=UPI001C57042A|nr:hypothetical protein [Pseudomonas sp. UMAB-40]
MHIQHFTIVQHKFLYVNENCEAFWFHEGLHPSDGIRQRLIPVLVLTLNVEGLGLYHQRYYRHDEGISLAEFFHDAWTNSTVLKGIPEQLCIDKELLNAAPLIDILKQVDEHGHIKHLVTNGGRVFGASKAQAQKQTYTALSWDDIRDKPKPDSIKSMFKLFSENLRDHESFCTQITSTRPKSQLENFYHHMARTPELPSHPEQSDFYRFNEGWVTRPSSKVPPLAEGQVFIGELDKGWVHWVSLGYEDDHFEDEDAEDENDFVSAPLWGDSHYWASELDGLQPALQALPYPLDHHLPLSLPSTQFQAFLAGREALSKFRVSDLVNLIHSLPLIIFPKTYNDSRLSFEYLSHGGDCRYIVELVGGLHTNSKYRVFACDGCAVGLFLIVIKAESKANGPKLKSAFFCIDEDLNIGQAGFAALTFWIDKVAELKSEKLCSVVLDMVREILRVSPPARISYS